MNNMFRINAFTKDFYIHRNWEECKRKFDVINIDFIKEYYKNNLSNELWQETIITSNSDEWPSYSDYIIELSKDDSARKIYEAINSGHKTFYYHSDYHFCEQNEFNRELSLFKWNRPLNIIATIISVDNKNKDRFAKIYPKVIGIHQGEDRFLGFLPGSPQFTDEWS